jgi:glycerol-3-phosphate dehydrogenase (NAD(P)+)
MDKKTKIAVLGAGQFGFYIAKYLGEQGFSNVHVYDTDEKVIDSLKKTGFHPIQFSGAKLPDSVKPETHIRECVSEAEIVFAAIPAQFMRTAIRSARQYIKSGASIINVAKALEKDSDKRMDEIFKEELEGVKHYAVSMAGGMLASEGVKGDPLTADIACSDINIARELASLLKSSRLKLNPISDIIGVELAGALKNVYAIIGGMFQGLGYGISSVSALISECAEEGRRFAVEYGTDEKTFSTGSHAWLADLITTFMGGRNSMFGQEIGRGLSPETALEKMKLSGKGTVEGYATAKVIYDLLKEDIINYPILREIYFVLYEGKNPEKAISDLMNAQPIPRRR